MGPAWVLHGAPWGTPCGPMGYPWGARGIKKKKNIFEMFHKFVFAVTKDHYFRAVTLPCGQRKSAYDQTAILSNVIENVTLPDLT